MRKKVAPRRELLFAAKMGFISKRLWIDFFTRTSRSQNSRRWRALVSEGYFKKHESKSLTDVLVLDKKGRAYLHSMGVGAVVAPHMNQVDHDEAVSRILVQLEEQIGVRSIETESELKQKFTLWMRTTREGRGTKFPDLTLTFNEPCKFRRMALEVELSKKSFDRYKATMMSYSTKSDIDAVVFIAEQRAIFDRLARAMKAINYPSWDRPVGFSPLKEWVRGPTTAPIYLSDGVGTLVEWAGARKLELSNQVS